MIITKTWLNEFINIKDKSLNDLVETLNSIGIEVSNAYAQKVPDKVVIGFVKEKVKHENSDKLHICKVDVGDEDLQIVCGASNVDEGQFVAVALNGAKLPNGMNIKATKIRGVDSYGMICSSTELNLAKINDGIMILDESIGTLEPGKALNSLDIFNDDVIEVELTPNRGDCFSVHGIARDLSSAYDLDLKKQITFVEGETVGIGRVLRIISDKDLNGAFIYRLIEIKDDLELNLFTKLRLATAQILKENTISNFLTYASHSTGVIFNAYDMKVFKSEDEILSLKLSKGKFGENVLSFNDKKLSVAGIFQEDFAKINNESKFILIEASYTRPEIIAESKMHYKKQDNETIYRSFRGSEPKLSIGINCLLNKMAKYDNINIYMGSHEVV